VDDINNTKINTILFAKRMILKSPLMKENVLHLKEKILEE
jgi:hypothetical protein